MDVHLDRSTTPCSTAAPSRSFSRTSSRPTSGAGAASPGTRRRRVRTATTSSWLAGRTSHRLKPTGGRASRRLPRPHADRGRARADASEEGLGACEVRLSEARTRALRALAKEHGLTLNTLLQGAWALLLHRYTGEEDVVFGSTRACRRSALGGADDVVGLLINTLPIRVRIDPEAALVPWLRRLREQQVALRPYEHTPLVKVQAWSEVRARPAALREPRGLRERDARRRPPRSRGSLGQPPLPLPRPDQLPGHGHRLRGPGAPPAPRVRPRAHRRQGGPPHAGPPVTLMDGMAAAAPEAPLATLPLLTEEERQHLVPPPAARVALSGPCVHERFETQVERTPRGGGAHVRRRVADVRRAEPPGESARAPVARPRCRPGDAGGAEPGALSGPRGRHPRDPQGGRRLPAPRPRVPAGPPGLHGRGRAGAGHRHRARARGSVAAGARRPSCSWTRRDRGRRTTPRSGATAANLAYVIYTSGSTGQAEGLPDHARQRHAAARRDRELVRLRPGRRVDALPLLRVRLLGVGAVGIAALRRAPGGRALLGEPVARTRSSSCCAASASPSSTRRPPPSGSSSRRTSRPGSRGATSPCATWSSAARLSICRASAPGTRATATSGRSS